MANESSQAADHVALEAMHAKAQVQFLLGQLEQLGNSSIQVRVDGGTEQENQVAQRFVEGSIVLMRRFGAVLEQAAQDSVLLEVFEQQITDNPATDWIVPDEVVEATLAEDASAPVRLMIANLASWHEANPNPGQ